MKTRRRELQAMRDEVRQGPDRSRLFWWMVDHYAQLIDEGRAGRMPWLKLCKRFAAEGLTDGRGKEPTPARAGKTWREARAEVRAAAERLKTGMAQRSQAPSRQRPEWQPPLAETSRAVRQQHLEHHDPGDGPGLREPTAAPAQSAAGASGKMTIDDLSPEARAKVDKLRRQFAETDRKRFGSL